MTRTCFDSSTYTFFLVCPVKILPQVSYLYNLQCDNDRRSPYLWQFEDKA